MREPFGFLAHSLYHFCSGVLWKWVVTKHVALYVMQRRLETSCPAQIVNRV